jgi:hypothetical protein
MLGKLRTPSQFQLSLYCRSRLRERYALTKQQTKSHRSNPVERLLAKGPSSLASDRCVEMTLAYFTRFGAAALLFSRFSTSVRLLASACAAVPS